MRPLNQLALLWAAVSAIAVIACALMFAHGTPLQTNLLALLPQTERNAVAERAAATLADGAANRAVFLVGHKDRSHAAQAARQFADSLRTGNAFARVLSDIPPLDSGILSRPYVPFRFGLLAEADYRLLKGGEFDAEARLLQRLNNPFQAGMIADATLDPFGFLDDFLAGLPYSSTRLRPEDGLLTLRDGNAGSTYILVTAELRGSAYDSDVQQSALEAIALAAKSLRASSPDAELLRTGAVFFAEAARSAAEHEMHMIGLGSLAGVMVLLLVVFRSARPLLLGLLTVAIGLAIATIATVMVHGELHLLTLIFGAALIGEAVDYSIQYFAVYSQAGSTWDAGKGLQSIRPGLAMAVSTSLLGYAALLFVPFPAVNQIALFALTGLSAAYVSVIALLPALLRRPYAHDLSWLTAPAARFIAWWCSRVTPLAGIAIIALIVVLCVPGWLRLDSDDNLRAMANHSGPLLEQESRIRSLTGFGNASQFFLVEGSTAEEVLRREEALGERLRELVTKSEISYYHAVSSFVPSLARQTENRELMNKALFIDRNRLYRAFQNIGFEKGVPAGMDSAFRQSEGKTLTPQGWLATPAATLFRHLWLGATEHGQASAVMPFGFARIEPLETAAAGLPGVTLVDKAGSVSRLLKDYRRGFSMGLMAAVLLVWCVLSRRYGWARAAAVALPSLLGIAIALTVAGHTGNSITLFSVLALILVLGVGGNYAIFLVEGKGREGSSSIAVALSAATTLLSFGLLSFSTTPALARFGEKILLVGISAAVLLSPLALTFSTRSDK